jgi:hypothetical protein
MPLPTELESISGAQELFDWFGYWPSFHDAELNNFRLSLVETCELTLYTWQMTNKVDPKGFYETVKHLVVRFTLEGIASVSITSDPWDRSVLLNLSIEKSEIGFRLSFDAAFGLSGSIDVQDLSIAITPGVPN